MICRLFDGLPYFQVAAQPAAQLSCDCMLSASLLADL